MFAAPLQEASILFPKQQRKTLQRGNPLHLHRTRAEERRARRDLWRKRKGKAHEAKPKGVKYAKRSHYGTLRASAAVELCLQGGQRIGFVGCQRSLRLLFGEFSVWHRRQFWERLHFFRVLANLRVRLEHQVFQ